MIWLITLFGTLTDAFPPIMSEQIQVIILAIVQGIAEFLPISSSGHLNVIQALLSKIPETAELNVVLHFGTLLAILVYYRKRIIALLQSDRRVIPLLIIGTIPAAVVGITIKEVNPDLLVQPLIAGLMFPVTGLMLYVLTRLGDGKDDYAKMDFKTAILIGVAQSLALLPGISRSGSTIVAGSMLGLRREEAMTYSFLLAIPAIFGASVLELKDIMDAGWVTATSGQLLLVGTVIAFAVGLVSLRLLDGLLRSGKLQLFVWYLVPLGIAVVLWQMLAPGSSFTPSAELLN